MTENEIARQIVDPVFKVCTERCRFLDRETGKRPMVLPGVLEVQRFWVVDS